MLQEKPLKRKQQPSKKRWAILGCLFILLLLIGHQETAVKGSIIVGLSKIYSFFQGSDLDILHTFFSIKNEERAANLVFRVLYSSVCLSIIHFYFLKPQLTKLAFLFYLFLYVSTLTLYFAAEQLQLPSLHIVAFRIDSLMISPMPVVILIPARYIVYLSDSKSR